MANGRSPRLMRSGVRSPVSVFEMICALQVRQVGFSPRTHDDDHENDNIRYFDCLIFTRQCLEQCLLCNNSLKQHTLHSGMEILCLWEILQ